MSLRGGGLQPSALPQARGSPRQRLAMPHSSDFVTVGPAHPRTIRHACLQSTRCRDHLDRESGARRPLPRLRGPPDRVCLRAGTLSRLHGCALGAPAHASSAEATGSQRRDRDSFLRARAPDGVRGGDRRAARRGAVRSPCATAAGAAAGHQYCRPDSAPRLASPVSDAAGAICSRASCRWRRRRGDRARCEDRRQARSRHRRDSGARGTGSDPGLPDAGQRARHSEAIPRMDPPSPPRGNVAPHRRRPRHPAGWLYPRPGDPRFCNHRQPTPLRSLSSESRTACRSRWSLVSSNSSPSSDPWPLRCSASGSPR